MENDFLKEIHTPSFLVKPHITNKNRCDDSCCVSTKGGWESMPGPFYANAAKSGINWGAAPVPEFYGKPYSFGGATGLGIPKQPEGTPKEVYEAAMKFIKFYIEAENMAVDKLG